MDHPTTPAGELRFAAVPIVGVEVRDPQASYDNTWTMTGYAAVFDTPTVLYNGKFVRVSESIDPSAFDVLLREQPLNKPEGVVHFNFGHDMSRAVAATDVPTGAPGSLELRADSQGLFFTARVSRDDPDAVAMASKMRTGVLRQASFAFTVARAEDTTTENEDGPDEYHRRILEMGHLYDVCACAQGAYPQTVSQLRSYAAAITPFDPSWEAGSDVRPLAGSVADKRTEEQIRASVMARFPRAR